MGLTIKGGDAISKYGLSVGYQNYSGIIRNTNYDRINLRFVGSFNVFEWMEMYISTSLSNNHSNLRETGISPSTSPVMAGLVKSPVMAPYQYDEEGRELTFLDDVDPFGVSNPTAIINGSEAHNRNYKFLGTFSLIGNITRELKWNSLLGLNFGNMKENVFMPDAGMETYLNWEGYNEVRLQAAYIKSLYFDNYFEYKSDVNVMHQYSARVGLRVNTNHSELDYGTGYNTPSDEYKSLRFAHSLHAKIGGDIGNWNWMSFYGNAGYSFKNKYMLGLNVSMDGSSRTGKDAETALRLFNFPFGLFYSVNGAWRLSAEPFMYNISWLDELKLRFSMGISGNVDFGNYSSRRYYSQLKYRETTGVIMGTKPVTDLKFETVGMTNLGMDLSMFGERFNFVVDYFMSTTDNMMIYERQEDFIGYAYRPTNGGSLQNSGYEVRLSGRIISAGKFKLDAGLNIAHYNNEVLSIKGGSLVTEIEGGEILSSPGNPVNSFYGYIFEGVFTTRDEATEAGLVNDIGLPFSAGDVKFSDLSGPDGQPDGVINEYDKTIIGSPNPDYFGGVNLRASYSRWSLSTTIQFVSGNDVFNYMRYRLENMSNLHNQSTAVLNRWQYEGQITDMPRSNWNDPLNNNEFSTRWIEDGSYIRGKNVTLSYTIPENFLFFNNARFFVTVMNAFTLTKYLGYDPEFSYSSDQLLMGVDYGMMPQSKNSLQE